ncbi:MAG: tRNA lysidine(34) synthetase TilS [Alphaproteobacteria bacterium]|nr:tRNA lysidine(34) synthetase TilS [Alphaproteobacteria bacterium]
MNQKFVDFMNKYQNVSMALGVSGGVDSMCLLYWLHEIGANVYCLHVNHRLRPEADIETEYVIDVCKKLNIPCHIFYWNEKKPENGLEAAAREARYKMMTDFCHENNIEYLVTAHQSDDQIETFLMNLSRGSGLYGLSAMLPESERNGIKIIRPLLEVSRKEIRQYCDDNNIRYFIDSMNSDDHYTRVKIRKNRHLLEDDLGISDSRILLAIQNLGRTREWMDKYISLRIEMVIRSWGAMFISSFLFDEAEEIRLKFLGSLIQKIGGNDYPVRLNSLKQALCNLQSDCKFTLGHCTIRRLGDRILIVPEGKKTSFRKRHEKRKKNI